MTTHLNTIDFADSSTINWSPDAPRGGKAVMNRILKEKATVPLFFAQTLISSMRDVGYNHTTSALCEHVDNAIQADATQIRVYFRQTGKRGEYEIDCAVFDNGVGMTPTVMKVATSFGGSMSFNNRSGIGRFGMGMKTAALSMSPVMDLYSWQEDGAFYNMTLDVESIGKERANLVELPDPNLVTDLPDDITTLLTKPMVYPKDHNDQTLLADSANELLHKLGSSGTIVYMPQCDRLTFAKASTLVDHAVKEMSRIYRRAIGGGLHLYINNRLVEAFDPTYSMTNARHVKLIDLPSKQSRLILSRSVEIPIRENSKETSPITIKMYKLPIEDWHTLPRKVLKNDLRVFDRLTVSILRNDRELFAGELPALTTQHNVTNWYRVQIDFTGVLDEAFGVAANKQGVRMKEYVLQAIKHAIGDDITSINDEIKRFQGKAAQSNGGLDKPSASEARASDADSFQTKPLLENLTAHEQEQLEANWRGLAVSLKRDGETEDQAFERIKASKYLISFCHDDYWPFYHVEHRFGRVILKINTAHAFFSELYEPIRKLSVSLKPISENEDAVLDFASDAQHEPIVALELLLLSLARTQSVLGENNDEARKLLENFRREWSEAYRIQLTS